jgi:hypothetical protein
MSYRRLLDNTWSVVKGLVRYNFKIIFANKFLYFLGAALFIFLGVTALNLINSETRISEGTVYWLLLVPGILLIFYPSVFGIQNDVDNRMIEILFGIPNYRYKVWLLRLVLIFALAAGILTLLAVASSFALVPVPVFRMVFQLMFPVMFLGCLAFLVSTIVKNGSGTAVVIVLIGLWFWIAQPSSASTMKWNVFLNPFAMPENMNQVAWADIVLNNRIYLAAGIMIALLWGLLNLQKREKFL